MAQQAKTLRQQHQQQQRRTLGRRQHHPAASSSCYIQALGQQQQEQQTPAAALGAPTEAQRCVRDTGRRVTGAFRRRLGGLVVRQLPWSRNR